MIKRAYNIIFIAFQEKFDKAGEPYIFHLKRVADSFKEDEYLYTVALLHDLIEDCEEWTIEELQKEFPNEICMAVKALTKIEGENYEDYLSRVGANDWARKVKLADLKDNMDLTRLRRKIEQKDWDRVAKYHSAYLRLSDF